MERYLEDPKAAAFALFTEALSLALNPRMQLFAKSSAYDLVVNSGNQKALNVFNQMLDACEWGLYRVERIYERKMGKSKPYTRVDRRVACQQRGNREYLLQQLKAIATERNETIDSTHCASRVYSHRRKKDVYPAIEAFWVICPALVEDKVRNAKEFQRKWNQYTGVESQLALF